MYLQILGLRGGETGFHWRTISSDEKGLAGLIECLPGQRWARLHGKKRVKLKKMIGLQGKSVEEGGGGLIRCLEGNQQKPHGLGHGRGQLERGPPKSPTEPLEMSSQKRKKEKYQSGRTQGPEVANVKGERHFGTEHGHFGYWNVGAKVRERRQDP